MPIAWLYQTKIIEINPEIYFIAKKKLGKNKKRASVLKKQDLRV